MRNGVHQNGRPSFSPKNQYGFRSFAFCAFAIVLCKDILETQVVADAHNRDVSSQGGNTSHNASQRSSQRRHHGCRCRNGTRCDQRTGLCPHRCPDGWTPDSIAEPCVQISSPQQKLLPGDDRIDQATKLETNSASERIAVSVTQPSSHVGNVNKSQYVLSFKPVGVCNLETNDVMKTWKINVPVPYAMQALFLYFNRTLQLGDSLNNNTLTISTSPMTSKADIECLNSKTPRMSNCSVFLDSAHVFLEAVTITTASTKSWCPPLALTKAMLHGLPVCPYFHWGPHCQRACHCRCGLVDCHPLTGACDQRVVRCKPGLHGASCDRPCSTQCNTSQTQECHVVTGSCKACAVVAAAAAESFSHAKPCTAAATSAATSAAAAAAGAGGTKSVADWNSIKLKCGWQTGGFRIETLNDEIRRKALFEHLHRKEPINATMTIKPTSSALHSHPNLYPGILLVIIVGSLIIAVVFFLCAWILTEMIRKREWRKERMSIMTGRYKARASMRTLNGFDVEFQEMEDARSNFEVCEDTPEPPSTPDAKSSRTKL